MQSKMSCQREHFTTVAATGTQTKHLVSLLLFFHFQTFILPYIYQKKSKEEEKLEAIETTVTELKENMRESGTVTQNNNWHKFDKILFCFYSEV